MERENQYSKFYKGCTTVELKKIITQKELYHDEARVAAFLELKNQGILLNSEEESELQKLTSNLKVSDQKAQSKKKEGQKPEINNPLETPSLYSPTAVLGFTILFSVIFGGILMFLNLRTLNKKSTALKVLFATIGFMLIGGLVAQWSEMNQWVIMLVNVIGGIVLIEFFWKKYIGNTSNFNRKSILKPAVISLLVSFLVTYLFIYLNQGVLPGM
ncbi:hypothetical protein [Aquimarina agarivorans]|uniref:hypothetical protein n=1 Tax=Aquimarina agarivorans TaxID=980584 RepID=UPI000248F580|nr:hypothetical protein [Aquimarina agarivorans]